MTVSRPYSLPSGRGRHAIDDFFLQHEMHVLDRAALAEQMKQHGRRNIVGKVADDPQLRPRRRGAREVGVQHVPDVYVQAPLRARIRLEQPCQVAVDLDGVQRAHARASRK